MPIDTDQDVETPEQEPEPEPHGQMSFLDHLEELRQRIIKMLIAIGICFVAMFSFADQLFRIVKQPVDRFVPNLVFTSLTEPFNIQMKVAFIAALGLCAPYLLSQVWLFISPGLYKHERRYAGPFIVSCTLLFALGVLFAYFIAFPFAAEFLVKWGGDLNLAPMLTAREYFDLLFTIIVIMGLVFQIPSIIFILARIGLVSGPFLLRNTRYAILVASILAAVITPTTDIPSMVLMAGPMVLLYFIGIGVAYVFGKKRRAEAD